MKEKKEKCLLCDKCLCWNSKKRIRPHVRVKTDLFGKKLDEVFHERCWEKLHIEK